jgi:hypothetical protein
MSGVLNEKLEERSSAMDKGRVDRLQIMLTPGELAALDDWRFSRRMPSRAAAVRELLKRGLAAEGFEVAEVGTKSGDYAVVDSMSAVRDDQPAGSEGN